MGSLRGAAERELAGLRAAAVRILDGEPRDIRCHPGRGVDVDMGDGQVLAFDVLYPAQGLAHASQLATALGPGRPRSPRRRSTTACDGRPAGSTRVAPGAFAG